jgi:hypothetical protein
VKALAKFAIAMVVVLVALVVIVGPGGVVAGAEYPLGIGPWSSTGHYCHTVDEVAQFGDHWKLDGQPRLTARQRTSWLAMQKALTNSGPAVARADFTTWYRMPFNLKSMANETKLINTWWNQNCADPMMDASASVAHTWSGIALHARFTHYPKNVLHLGNFIKLTP